MSALLSPYMLLTLWKKVGEPFEVLHLFRNSFMKINNISKLKENFELFVLVSIFISTVYAVAPAV